MKYFSFILILLMLSCKKDKSCEACTSPRIEINTIIVDSGPTGTDGCSFLIKINDSQNYHPDVLDTAFQHNGLKVKVSYQLTSDVFICGLNANKIPVIHINTISKQ